jgi:hypothetical protein
MDQFLLQNSKGGPTVSQLMPAGNPILVCYIIICVMSLQNIDVPSDEYVSSV